jgi:hypothetical protein
MTVLRSRLTLPTIEEVAVIYTRAKVALLAAGCVVVLVLTPAKSLAALDVAVGARQIVKNEPVSTCNTKAKNALDAVLQDAAEVGSGDTGEWKAYGAPDASGQSSSAAAIHCYPVDNGYVVTFTCAVETQPNADTAAALCGKLSTAFGGPSTAVLMPASAGLAR